MKIDKHFELLTRLYLRLKGFLVSNLILHSDMPGHHKSELDILALRLPFHDQEYRYVNVPDFLECSDSRIEIIIADVKNYSKLDPVKFNDGLRKDRESIKQLISWIGAYREVTPEIIEKFEHFLNLHKKKDWNAFASFDEDLHPGSFRFKFTFFCPSLPKWGGPGFKYVHGEEMISFAWECLNETRRILTCSRRYDFGAWNELQPYVLFFKNKDQRPSITDFEDYCKKLNDTKTKKLGS